MIPIGNNIIVRQDSAAQESSMIAAPESFEKKPYTGEVIFAGKDSEAKPGDTVVFDKWSFVEIEYNGEVLLMLNEENASIIFNKQ
jgi:co-chaperonin GroES (HSP10)